MPIVIPEIPLDPMSSGNPASRLAGTSRAVAPHHAGPAAEAGPAAAAPRWYGVYPAIVTDTADPTNAGRVRVRLPWATATDQAWFELWARLASPFAGPGIGAWFEPPIDAEVLVAFIGGDPSAPCIVGGLWSRANLPPPGTVQTGRPGQHVIRTAAGAGLD